MYNIDQSDPNFKRTKAFEDILKKQKQKARLMIENEQTYQSNKSRIESSNLAKFNEKKLNTLVRKVKNKTNEQFNDVRKRTLIEPDKRFNINKKFRC